MKVINSADHWTPQSRKRAITLLSKKWYPKWEFPNKQPQITVREAIGHLPSLESSEKSNIKYHYAKKHNENHIQCMKHTPTWKTAFDNKIHFPKKNNGDRIKWFSTTYKRIEWDKPAPTITMCNGAISSQNNVHPWRPLENELRIPSTKPKRNLHTHMITRKYRFSNLGNRQLYQTSYLRMSTTKYDFKYFKELWFRGFKKIEKRKVRIASRKNSRNKRKNPRCK